MKQLIIDRKKWRTGGDGYALNRQKGHTSLYNDRGYSCCLGFYCRKIGGIRNNVLLDVGSPDNLNIKDFTKIELLVSRNSRDEVYSDSVFSQEAIDINDDPDLSNEERESTIIEHFKKVDIEVIFKNKYPE
jgi:hypothetical protein